MKIKTLLMMLTIVVVLIFLGYHASGSASSIYKSINVSCGQVGLIVDGQKVSDNMSVFIDSKNSAFVSIRDIFQILGKTVFWDTKSQTIYADTMKKQEANKNNWQNSFSWLEEMTVLRNIGPFFQKKEKNFMIAADKYFHGVAVKLKENQSAEVVVKTNGKYHGFEGRLGVEDSSMNSSGAFFLTVFTDGVKVYESPKIFPASYPLYISSGAAGDIGKALTVKFHVTWADSGCIGEDKEVTAVLADFKMLK